MALTSALLLLLSTSIAALPAPDAAASSTTSTPTTAATNSSAATSLSSSVSPTASSGAWLFDPSYDGRAPFVYDFVNVRSQTKDMWQSRKIGDWLSEYSARVGIVDSPNYVQDLVKSYAFHDEGLDCRIDSTDCSFDGGMLQSGLPNDEFNALLVRAALRNYWLWFSTMYQALENTKTEMNSDIGLIVEDLLPAWSPPSTGFWDWKNPIFQDIFNIAMIFVPTEAIIANLAEKEFFVNLPNSGLNDLTKWDQEILDQTKKDITGNWKKITDSSAQSYKFLKDVLPYMPTGSSSESLPAGDNAPYQVQAAVAVTEYQTQLGNALDKVLNNAYSFGGFISQVYNGDWVENYDKSTSWQTDALSTATNRSIQAIGAMTVSGVIRDNPVLLIKRRNGYGSWDDCMGSYNNDDGFTFAYNEGHSCILSDDGQWHPWFPIQEQIYDGSTLFMPMYVDCQTITTFRGSQALLGGTYNKFILNSDQVFQESLACSASQHSFAYPTENFYPSPNFNGSDPDAFATSTPCLYNLPVCDMTSADVLNGCRAYRDDVSNLMLQFLPGDYHGPNYDPLSDCSEVEEMMFCAQTLAIGRGETTIQNLAQSYDGEFKNWWAKTWDGLTDVIKNDCFKTG